MSERMTFEQWLEKVKEGLEDEGALLLVAGSTTEARLDGLRSLFFNGHTHAQVAKMLNSRLDYKKAQDEKP